MRIFEIIENDAAPKKSSTVDQAAQLYAQHGQTLSSEVIMVAKRIHANSNLDANDAISMAKEISDKSDKKKPQYAKPDTVRKPMGDRKPAATNATDRVSKTGKKWGNQYYADPSKDRVSKSTKYKNVKDKVKKAVGAVTRQDDIDMGLDISSDITTNLDKIMNLGKSNKTR